MRHALTGLKWCLFLMCCLIVTLPRSHTATADPIDILPADLKALLSGNSLAGNGKVKDPQAPYDWVAHYAADGTLRLKLKPEWGGTLSTGRWWMNEDGHQCRKFDTGHKKEGCWRFVREGKFVRFLPVSGVAVEGRAIVMEGDALADTD